MFPSAALAQRYDVVDLKTIGGSNPYTTTYGYPYGINSSGHVVGVSYRPTLLTPQSAYIWQDGTISELNADPLVLNSVAYRINDSDVAVGYQRYRLPDDRVVSHAFVWRNGIMTDVDESGGTNSIAASVNNLGQVVGSFIDTTSHHVHTFIWQSGDMTDLGDLGGSTFSGAVAINDSGQIVGSYDPQDTVHGYLLHHGAVTNLGAFVNPEDINNKGQVVGHGPIFENNHGIDAFIWENGVLTDLGTPDGGEPRAYAINDSGQVVGGTTSSRAFIWEDGEMRDLNTLIDPSIGYTWILEAGNDINNKGEIVCQAYHINDPNVRRMFLLKPRPLSITHPSAGVRWIAGERDTIRWSNGAKFDSLQILFSQDSGATYTMIADNVPAEVGYFSWDIPEDILSTDCFIRLSSIFHPSQDTTSGLFRVKAYRLTRFDTRGKYDPYQPGLHGWGFPNDSAYLWPAEWWSQFDYRHGVDPYTLDPYPIYFQEFAHPEDFIDWPLFVKVYTPAKCYFNNPGSLFPVYRPSSVQKFFALRGTWGGSCFGMATSSFQAFEFKSSFLARFPGVGPFVNLSSVSMSPAVRLAINELWEYQLGVPHSTFVDASWDAVTPAQTVSEVKEMVMNDVRNDRVLVFWDFDQTGGHAVSPYMVKKDPSDPDVERIYVYDNNYPGDNNAYFSVNTKTNVWSYNRLPWYGTAHLFLMDPVSEYFFNPGLPEAAPKRKQRFGASMSTARDLEIYCPSGASVVLQDTLGGVLSYADSVLTDSMAGAVPIIPTTGGFHPPIGYTVPPGAYSVRMSAFQDSVASVFVFSDSAVFRYSRFDARPDQADGIVFDGGLQVHSGDSVMKDISIETILVESSRERSFTLTNLALGKDDSLAVSVIDQNSLTLRNKGTAKLYALALDLSTPTGEERFFHGDIPLPAHATQRIVPDWSDLHVPATILVDYDNDGTIDDSLKAANQATDVQDQGRRAVPSALRLYQNYPNPFNPRTTISYDLPDAAHVTLQIFDVFGREVATLVDGAESAGEKSVTWEAAGVSSGVYLCRLNVNGSVLTKKLVLLK